MLLAIDAGNTNTVFALCKESEIIDRWRCKTEAGRTADEYAGFLLPLLSLENYRFEAVKGIIISSVVPEVNFNLQRFCESYVRQTPYIVHPGMTDFGIEVKLDNPETAGSDRLINAVAVKAHYQSPAIVIDFGTSTNFDVIDADGAHIGGALGIGLNLSLEALHRAASKLPKVELQKPPRAIGTNTVHAMQSGLYYGYAGLINGLLDSLSSELPKAPFIIATGGLAHVFKDDIPRLNVIDDDLTLKGLVEVWERNKN